MAFKVKLKPNTQDSHQTSSGYVITFLRWGNRDTFNFPNLNPQELKKPLVVINDCIDVTVTKSKSSHLGAVQMTFLAGDINYSTAIAPGDFVLVNLLNSQDKLIDVYNRALNLQPINNYSDGFKGIYRVQSVRRELSTAPGSGAKSFTFSITAASFKEFEQVIYFNRWFYKEKTEFESDKFKLMANNYVEMSSAKDNATDAYNLQRMFKTLVNFTIGKGNAEVAQDVSGVKRNYNRNFLMPDSVGQLLGIKVNKAADLFRYFVGVERYSDSSANNFTGLNPTNASKTDLYYECSDKLTGSSILLPDVFSQNTAWSILNQYSNPLINEMFTTTKVTPEGKVLPCVVFRQKPFTSSHFKTKFPNSASQPTTEFMNLPRWVIDPQLVFSASLGRDEQARINFVHVIGQAKFIELEKRMTAQEQFASFNLDEKDIEKSGLKPYIVTNNFDLPSTGQNDKTLVPVWKDLVFDFLASGQLKENGSITTVGIVDPISVGDNIELDGIVYHIESVTHKISVNSEGYKNFQSSFSLSFGTDIRSNQNSPVYPESDFVDVQSRREQNYTKGDKTLPGFSEAQDLPSRRKSKGENFKKSTETFNSVPGQKTLESFLKK